jgi:chaperonin GroES
MPLVHFERRTALSWVVAALALTVAGPAFAVNIRPLNDRVVVQRVEEQTRGGIVIPDSAKEKAAEAVVVVVGPGRWSGGTRVPVELNPGDRVLFGKYAGSEVKLDGEEYLILREDDILGVLED